MAKRINDQSVLGHIDALVKEEERLYAQQELTDDDRGRLAKIKVELDRYNYLNSHTNNSIQVYTDRQRRYRAVDGLMPGLNLDYRREMERYVYLNELLNN